MANRPPSHGADRFFGTVLKSPAFAETRITLRRPDLRGDEHRLPIYAAGSDGDWPVVEDTRNRAVPLPGRSTLGY